MAGLKICFVWGVMGREGEREGGREGGLTNERPGNRSYDLRANERPQNSLHGEGTYIHSFNIRTFQLTERISFRVE